jgi:DNA (cytosine-5)-methyltransferase 1
MTHYADDFVTKACDVPYRGKPAADGPRYKALGNSMAVPVMSWIGERIAAVASLEEQGRVAA